MHQKGHYRARWDATPADLLSAQTLRQKCFRSSDGLDQDCFDFEARHLLIEDTRDGQLLACCRLTMFASGAEVTGGYAGAHYDLAGWHRVSGPVAELGRFCVGPEGHVADVLRMAWGALAQEVIENDVQMIFGCTSFVGTNLDDHGPGLLALHQNHLGPRDLRPGVKSAQVVRFADLTGFSPDGSVLPALLRSYLAMGGWVGDHAVVDTDLKSLHVLTAVECSSVPQRRRQSLLAGIGRPDD